MTRPSRHTIVSIALGYIISCYIFAPCYWRVATGTWPNNWWDFRFVVLLAPVSAPGFAILGPFVFPFFEAGLNLHSAVEATVLTSIWIAIMLAAIALVHRVLRRKSGKTAVTPQTSQR
jgi:hypothetical protein